MINFLSFSVTLALGASGQQFQRQFDNFQTTNPRFIQRNNFGNDDVVVLNNDALTTFGTSQQQRQANNQFTSNNFQVTAPLPLGNEFNTQTANAQFSNNQISNTQLSNNNQISNAQLSTNNQQQANFGSSRTVSNNNQGSTSFFRSGESSANFQQTSSQFDEDFGVFEPLNLPSGASVLLGSISSQFSCVGLPYGYYADEDNSCRVFHVCNPLINANEGVETYQYR